MKNVYELTAYNLAHGYRVEQRIFTNKKIAELSLQRLVDYLNHNHKLNPKQIDFVSNNDKQYRVVLDYQYAVQLRTIEIVKKACSYI